ncbi:glycosyltransferase family 4 protein [Flavobacterium sp. LPB0248]|uniref:glycosyltransferase family 4 protein n=1 Tax=Flavobacterium sp. LPB0248 TaxID=2614441 RepID=UPI0015A5DC80|nr:glycosyltransferase family 4 protein [Flavobacterium sp. LPB0248]QLC67483.1 glycosyltransferase family 4 protein [Flavobacterium sp. LPB0248]
MKKEIVFLEDSSKSQFGGGQRISLIVLKELSTKYFITLFDTSLDSRFNIEASQYVSKSYQLSNFSKVKSGKYGVFLKIIEACIFPFFIFLNIIKIKNTLDKSTEVILFATTKKVLIYAYFLNVLWKYNFVYHAHLVEKKRIVRFFYLKTLKKAKYVIAVSDIVKRNIGLKNVVLISNPIDLIIRSNFPKVFQKKVIVATFSTLIDVKGINYFIESYQYLNTNVDVEYWIFGEGPEKKNLIESACNKVFFKGFCDDVVGELSQFVHILCFPSIIEESFGMVIIEAFSSGVPVITTNIGGQSELVKDGYNGLHVSIKCAQEIAEKVTFLCNSPDLYKTFSCNALSSVKDFDISIFNKKLQKIVI